MRIKEVIVVEGKNDIAAVKRAVTADCLATGGFGLQPYRLEQIAAAASRRGIIILTDPDNAGERIRRTLSRHFPQAKHAFIPAELATAAGDIGIEQATPAAIRAALIGAHYQQTAVSPKFSQQDLLTARLTGTGQAALRRSRVGAILAIGHANAKTFLQRLNSYDIERAEFWQAVEEMEALLCNP